MTPPACPSRTSLRTPWCLPGGLLRASAPSRACFGRHRFPSTHLGTHTFVWQCETNNGGGRKERGRGQSLRKGVSWSAAQAGASLFMFPPVLESSYCAPSLLLMYEATRPHLYCPQSKTSLTAHTRAPRSLPGTSRSRSSGCRCPCWSIPPLCEKRPDRAWGFCSADVPAVVEMGAGG